ncbi:MAG TPA: hypothetical protein DEB09_02920 [Candidatus Magasanikbacteria bacterium]|nr:hypothetical protein [Candidatus Magasanikbacteria bacterium]
MEILSTLEKIGLNTNEAKTYLELLKLGSTNVGPIVTNTKLHRQLVYEALERLEDKNLVSYVIKNNRKYFQAASPSILLKTLEDKEAQIRKILPNLVKLQIEAIDKIEVKTFYGQKGFFDNLKDVVSSASKTDGIMRIIGGAKDIDFYRVIGNLYKNYVKYLEDNRVSKYLISPADYSEEFKNKFAKEKGNILKTMTVGLSSPTYTRITPEMVTIEIYTGSNDVTIIQIQNKAIAKGYLEHFELLWRQAKLYDPVLSTAIT